jgi:2'-5' RNA ligase
MRLFVALTPPPGVLDELDAACAPLRAGREDLRWTARETRHLTLAFLGEVGELPLTRLVPRLERGARRHRAFELALSGAGAFPSPRRANVLWSGLAGDRKALGDLAATVSAAARRAGAPPPDAGRPYRPHLTLARRRSPADLGPLVTALSGFQSSYWLVSEIHLIRSYLQEGPRYETLGSWKMSS